ncbi:MAG: hypothetical protein RR419_05815 [Akkermansia sp.]
MNADTLIYPFVKRIISILAWIVTLCSIYSFLIHSSLALTLTHTIQSNWLNTTALTGFISAQMITAICLLILAPWCTYTLLSGQGHPLLRLLSLFSFLLIPVGLFMTGINSPISVFFSYWWFIITGNPPSDISPELMQLFFARIDGISMAQLLYVCILIIGAWIRIAPGKTKTLLLLLGISGIISSSLPVITPLLMDIHPSVAYIIVTLGLIAPLLFWASCAFLAYTLATNAPKIASVPQKEIWEFPTKNI